MTTARRRLHWPTPWVTRNLGAIFLRGLDRRQRIKGLLLSSWFFLTVATLWLLKPVRVASLLVHLGAVETPYVRLAAVLAVAIVVLAYSAVVNRLSRIAVVQWVSLLFAAILLVLSSSIRIGGAWLGAQRPFVWAIYIVVEIYSVVMVGMFWTYANDVVSEDEANGLYGLVGLGGIVGGIAGGAFVDAFGARLGPSNLLLVCAVLVVLGAAVASISEAVLRPPARALTNGQAEPTLSAALEGLREVRASRYLLLIVGIVVTYEFTATLTDFGISVVFERAFRDEAELTSMYGRLGWIVSATAFVGQLVLTPLLLPMKRIALLVPPAVMLAGGVTLLAFPLVPAAMFLAAADRGLNYSVHQATKESLYVPLTDAQKYKAKALIDMLVDRAAKAGAAFVLIAIIAAYGASIRVALVASLASMTLWAIAAQRLGTYWDAKSGRFVARPRGETPERKGQRVVNAKTERS